MAEEFRIEPSGPVRGSGTPPGSKSITNRALVCAALADRESVLTGALRSEDTDVMVDCLRRLGVPIRPGPTENSLSITGCGGRLPPSQTELCVANSGTTSRFLTAIATLGRGVYRLSGSPRMHERPIQDLLDALNQLGADALSERRNGCPPVVVRGRGLRGGQATIAGNVSSQFLSALLMAAPLADAPVELLLEGELVSQPYVEMTLKVMAAFGAVVHRAEATRFVIPAPQSYRASHYAIEPDASAASYFFAAAAITAGQVTVEGLTRKSLQGDIGFCECLRQMGCRVDDAPDRTTVTGAPLRGIDANMADISDTAQTLAVVALFAEGPTTIRGVGHIRHKETDRLHALAVELRRLGADIDERPDGLRITPPRRVRAATVETYNDHRMAMSFALAGLAVPGIKIRDPQCVGKTYPNFFRDLTKLTGQRSLL
ncbi:MAG: 3-phosphoshikimate 1-carboxyvinyltransferase [Planctomycetaceae bacterium]|nr:3-phosphoshikimate 1-carboxyvinyltransferase [Planctomycetaceae bacterium]